MEKQKSYCSCTNFNAIKVSLVLLQLFYIAKSLSFRGQHEQ